jgi:hypothetical protein
MQSSVEWLAEHLCNEMNFDFWKAVEKAKQMEKEQLILFAEFVAKYPDKNRNANNKMLHAKSKYDGAETTLDLLDKFYNKTKEENGAEQN